MWRTFRWAFPGLGPIRLGDGPKGGGADGEQLAQVPEGFFDPAAGLGGVLAGGEVGADGDGAGPDPFGAGLDSHPPAGKAAQHLGHRLGRLAARLYTDFQPGH